MKVEEVLIIIIGILSLIIFYKIFNGRLVEGDEDRSDGCVSPVGTCRVGNECGTAGSGNTCGTMGRGGNMCGCFSLEETQCLQGIK
tara:strand:- start:383 stop:640 length:258 start_codon:yes stop_codon:yes gene_type:complete